MARAASEHDIGAARAALIRSGLCGAADIAAARIAAVGEHSNATFEIETSTGHFALRLPRADAGGFIDRAGEIAAQALAWRIGVGAEPVYADASSGVIATRWIDGAVPMSGDRLRNDDGALARATNLLARLHRSSEKLSGVFDAIAVIASYRARLAENSLRPDWSDRVDDALAAAGAAWTGNSPRLVPCHGDPAPANFLDAPERVVLIDWEYAGMNDSAWDLGYCALEANLDDGALARLLDAYDDATMTMARLRVAMLLAAAVGLLWTQLRARSFSSDDALSLSLAERKSKIEALAADPRLEKWLSEAAG